MRLVLSVGDHCGQVLNERMRRLPCRLIQADEICTYVAKKEKRVNADTNMSSSADNLRRIFEDWKQRQACIVVEISDPSTDLFVETFTGTIEDVSDWPRVTFSVVKTRERETLDFLGAEVRGGSFEKIDAAVIVRVFNVAWDSPDSTHFVRGTLTELRDLGKPN